MSKNRSGAPRRAQTLHHDTDTACKTRVVRRHKNPTEAEIKVSLTATLGVLARQAAATPAAAPAAAPDDSLVARSLDAAKKASTATLDAAAGAARKLPMLAPQPLQGQSLHADVLQQALACKPSSQNVRKASSKNSSLVALVVDACQLHGEHRVLRQLLDLLLRVSGRVGITS